MWPQSLWKGPGRGSQPAGGDLWVVDQIFPLWFLTVARLQLGNSNRIILWLAVRTTWGTVWKGCSIRKFENHWSRGYTMKEIITFQFMSFYIKQWYRQWIWLKSWYIMKLKVFLKNEFIHYVIRTFIAWFQETKIR